MTERLIVLVANRGEIARRIMATAKRLGHETVAVHTATDARAPHVTEADQSIMLDDSDRDRDGYLCVDLILAAAEAVSGPHRVAIHPGYGFLAENAEFARAVVDAGHLWIGPRPEVIDQMGSKINARALADAVGVATIPGFSSSQDDGALRKAAEEIGWPILVKASAGGGGKGIRIAHGLDEFDDALREARGESQRSFGDSDVIVERYIERPRHIEVQIMGDTCGNVVDLGTRECSVQRRYQKLFEEAPAPNLEPTQRASIRAAAVTLAKSVNYDSAGTVEFVVDAATGEFFFLEMNTRLQVEHPVTEAVTGLDLVELMIGVAAGQPLSIAAGDVAITGHALEARIAAEDVAAGFIPQIGTVHHLRVPHGIRFDSAVEEGSEISPRYDSMIAKLIVEASDRPSALARMRSALDALVIGGVVTTAGLHRWLVDQPAMIDAAVTTRFLDEAPLPHGSNAADAAIVAAELWRSSQRSGRDTSSPWSALAAFAVTPHVSSATTGLRDLTGEIHEVDVASSHHAAIATAAVVDVAARRVTVTIDGTSHHFELATRTERWAPTAATRAGTGEALIAPFPAVVAEVHATAGAVVTGDDVLVVIEAMKMLHSLRAVGTSTVDEVLVNPGESVSSNQILVTFKASDADPPQETTA